MPLLLAVIAVGLLPRNIQFDGNDNKLVLFTVLLINNDTSAIWLLVGTLLQVKLYEAECAMLMYSLVSEKLQVIQLVEDVVIVVYAVVPVLLPPPEPAAGGNTE